MVDVSVILFISQPSSSFLHVKGTDVVITPRQQCRRSRQKISAVCNVSNDRYTVCHYRQQSQCQAARSVRHDWYIQIDRNSF